MDMSRTIVVFGTLAAGKDTNSAINTSIFEAMCRVCPNDRVVRVSSSTIVDAIEDHRPRLVVGLGSIVHDHLNYAAIYRAAKTVGATLAYWLFDEPYERDFDWKLGGRADWIFTVDRNSSWFWETDRVVHLPLAADPNRHRRDFVPLAEREIDLFFCGVAYPNRRDLVAKLRHTLSRHDSVIRGDGWDENLKFCRNQRIPNAEMPDYFARSRIVLNIGRQFNIANRLAELVPSTPGPRTFEAAAAGVVQMTFIETMEIFDLFEPGREVIGFNSVDEFDALVDGILADPAAYDAVALAAQVRVLNEHTYDHRCRSLIDALSSAGEQ